MQMEPSCVMCNIPMIREDRSNFWRCPICGLRRSIPTTESGKPPVDRTSQKLQRGRANRGPRNRSPRPAASYVPPLPPPLPRSEEDSEWDRAEAKFDIYAGETWFRQQAIEWQQKRVRARTKTGRLRTAFRRNLCLALAGTLAQLSSVWKKDSESFYKVQAETGRCPQSPADTAAAYTKYVAQMRIAMRWLPDDPIVKRFTKNLRVLGDKAFLEKVRVGLGKGVMRPSPSPEDMMLDLTIFELHLDGLSYRQIAKRIQGERLLRPDQTLSHVAVSKRINSLRKTEPFRYLLRR